MATATFRPCPNCGTPLSFLEGVTASTRTPHCPRCRSLVKVDIATFLMLDTTRAGSSGPKPAAKK